jgi:hypothetical protein
MFGDGIDGGHGNVLKLERHHCMAGEVARHRGLIEAVTSTSAIWPVGVSVSGKVWTRYPMRCCDGKHRPNWPLPSTPIVEPGRMGRIKACPQYPLRLFG